MTLAPGSRLGPYDIVGPLGAGGMGEVYRATDTKLGRAVAIKVLPELAAVDPDRLARFRREAQVLAALNHANIAQIYGFEDGGGVAALVMELVEGPDLAERLAGGPLPLDEAVAAARQIAEALEAAHEQGIVHRDLKPANVKLRPDGSVKVLDFGLAKALDPVVSSSGVNVTMSPTLTGRLTQMGTIIGTAAYMAPEQAKGRAVDRRADIWAFGLVLYEMLTGHRAFECEDVSETLAAVLRQEVDLGKLPAAVPPSLRRLIERCLVRDPRQRLRDIGEARVLLERLQSGTGEEAPPAVQQPTVAAAPVAFWKRAVSALAFTVAGALVAGYAVWALRPAPPRPVTRFSVPLAEGQQFNASRRVVGVAPDGSSFAYVANRQILLRSLAGLEAHAIPGAEGGNPFEPVFSPDGQWLAYRSQADGSIKRISIAGGAPATICTVGNVTGLSWSEQGILFTQEKGVLRVSPSGGVPEVIAAAGPEEILDSPQLLPGGKALLLSVKMRAEGADKWQVVVHTLGDGRRKTLIPGAADAMYVPTGQLVYAESGVLFGVPFDLRSLSVTGSPVSVVEGVRRTFTTAAAHYAFSTTGTLVYVPGPAVVRGEERDLALFDRKDAAQPLKLPSGPYNAPRVSPDAKWVAFEREDEREANVWVYELGGATAMRRLTFGGKNRAPVWSGDSQWIAFQSDREGDSAIYRQRADGSGTAERMTRAEKGAAHIPQSWSPDGRRLLFTAQEGQRFSLWEMALDVRRTAPFAGVQSERPVEAAFSPDGKWVAYTGFETKTGSSTYVVPYPPTGAKYLVPGGGGHAFWSRRGDELLMNVGPGRSAAVAVRIKPQFGFGPPESLVRTARYEPNPAVYRRNADALPDGRILGVLSDRSSQGQPESPRFTVVLNWFEELRQRVR
jgi:Tol biopolymer transport system component